ncbi:MAG: 50S ribosomal protein L23 [Candidatus Azambacteria bacterium]|nr:50S ribosomal protein L23 [Candidatus Azambacteria bacterium]
MTLLNKLFKKSKREVEKKEPSFSAKSADTEDKEKKAEAPKKQIILESKILSSFHTTEKALAGQKLNQYVFKVSSQANKIMIAKEVKKNYKVKVVKVNIVNIPRKARRVGKTSGFRAGYKKAIVTLASGQTIEMTK